MPVILAQQRGSGYYTLTQHSAWHRIPAVLIGLARKLGVAHFIGTGENHAPMIHVEDLADAYVRALVYAPAGSLFNVPGGFVVRSKEVAQAISQAAGQGGRTESWSLEAARQFLGPLADALALDLQFRGAKAQRLLGWKPQGPSIIDDLLYGSYHRGVLAS